MNDSQIRLWDAHAHIQEPWFSNEEIEQVVSKSIDSSIEGIINVVSTPKIVDYNHGLELKENFPIIHLNFGLQPTESTKMNFDIFKSTVEKHSGKLCAIGEVGLDYHWVKDKKLIELQNKIFIEIIKFANEIKLPLVIHSRKAENDCLSLLERYADVPVLMHGIEASIEHIQRIIDLDYVLTIPTSVCNRKKYKKIALRTPLERILLETDSPFQLPYNQAVNDEKVKNEPANIMKSAKKLAEIKRLDFDEIAIVTRNNTKKFFRL